MNFTNLVLHGLSSISVYFDTLSVRILKLSLFGVLVCFLSVLSILYIKLFTESSIPGWASNLILIIFSIILQLFRNEHALGMQTKENNETTIRLRGGNSSDQTRIPGTFSGLAKQARVSGTVHLLGIVSKDGRVEQLQVTSGPALLVHAVADAVRRWAYSRRC